MPQEGFKKYMDCGLLAFCFFIGLTFATTLVHPCIHRNKFSRMQPNNDIFKQLGPKQLGAGQVTDLETIWFHPTLLATEFWSSQYGKHVNYHLGIAIADYYRTVYDLTILFFDGKELDIRKILQDAGFNVGEYHSIKDFQMVLKALGVDVHLVFKLYNDHPILDEIGIMFDTSGKLMNHPFAAQVPEGKFLFHTTPM